MKKTKKTIDNFTGEELFSLILKKLDRDKQYRISKKKKKTYIVPAILRELFEKISKKNKTTTEDTIIMLIDNFEDIQYTQDLDFCLKDNEIVFKLSSKYLETDLSNYKGKNVGIHLFHNQAYIVDVLKKQLNFKFNSTIMLFLICMYIRENPLF